MIFVEIDGTLEQLRGLHDLKGLKLQGGAHDLGGGLRRGVGTVADRATLDEVRARGLTVHVTMDEDEVKRRYEEQQRMMKDAFPEGLLEDRARQKPPGQPEQQPPEQQDQKPPRKP